MKESGENKKREKRGIKKTLYCYKCGGPVTEDDTSCPHCGAGPPETNYPMVMFRIALGVILAFILWFIYTSFYR